MHIGKMKLTRCWRTVAVAAAALSAVMCVNAADTTAATEPAALQRLRETAASRSWAWREAAADERAVFHGVVSYDAAGGGAGTMMYGPGPAGFLVALLTHAAINSSARSAEAKRIEEEADKVLLPLKDQLDPLRLRDFQQMALPRWEQSGELRLLPRDGSADNAWVVETQPVFLMTQDRRALVVETLVRFFDGAAAKTPAIERAVRVVSPAVKGDVDAYWRNSARNHLAQTASALLAEALRVAVLDTQTSGELSQRTVRYVEGGADKIERAAPLGERCERIALRTLRGGVMSVPARTRPSIGADASAESAAAPACGAPWPDVNAPVVAVAPTPAGDRPTTGEATAEATAAGGGEAVKATQ
jgi:hypothetical protein